MTVLAMCEDVVRPPAVTESEAAELPEESSRQRGDVADTLLHLGRLLGAGLTLTEYLDEMAAEAKTLFDADLCAILHFDHESDGFHLKTALTVHKDEAVPRVDDRLLVPIRLGCRLLAVMELVGARRAVCTESRSLAVALAGLAAVAIENDRLAGQIQDIVVNAWKFSPV